MVLYVSEMEMIERFSDSLKEAASRCRELPKTAESERPEIFVRLVSSLKISAGSAHQISMARLDPRWLQFRDTLEMFSIVAQETVFKDSDGPSWETIAKELDKLAYTGSKLFGAKARSRDDVLDDLLKREEANKEVVN